MGEMGGWAKKNTFGWRSRGIVCRGSAALLSPLLLSPLPVELHSRLGTRRELEHVRRAE